MPVYYDTAERSDDDISEYGSKATGWALRNGRHPSEYEEHVAAVERVKAEQTPEHWQDRMARSKDNAMKLFGGIIQRAKGKED